MRLADRALRQINPLLDVVGRAAGARRRPAHRLARCSTCSPPRPVRRRFGLDDDDLDRLRDLVAGSGVRWGLDAAHRAPVPAGRRSRRTPGRPGSTGCCSASRCRGRRAGWARRCRSTTSRRATSTGSVGSPSSSTGSPRRSPACPASVRSPRGSARSTAALDALTATDRRRRAGRRSRRGAELAEAAHVAGPHAAHGAAAASPTSARCSPSGCAAGRPGPTSAPAPSPSARWCRCARCRTASSACSGSTTACSRARAWSTATTCSPAPRCVGERDAAQRRPPAAARRDHGRDRAPRRPLLRAPTSAPGCRRPPAVPLGELLDAVAATAGPDAPARSSSATRCSPSTPATSPPRARRAGPFSFDRVELAGCPGRRGRAGATPAVPARPAARRPAPHRRARRPGDLRRAPGQGVPAPAGRACRSARRTTTPADALPVALDGLQWAVGDRLLRRPARRPATSTRCRRAEWRRGELPPGALGDRLLAEVLDDVEDAGRGEPPVPWRAHRRPGRRRGRGHAGLPDGTRVVGTVGGRARRHRRAGRVLQARRRSSGCGAWVRLVALTVARPDRRWRAVTVGRGARGGVAVPTVGPRRRRTVPAACSPTWSSLHRRGPARAAAAADGRRLRLRPHARRRRHGGRRAGRGAAGLVRGRGSRSATTRSTPACSAPRRGREVLDDGRHRRRADPVRRPRPAASGARCCDAEDAADDRRLSPLRSRSTSAAPLPTGTTVLEASAGTGKTFTIAALAARYVAEGEAALPELMLVTFGREATQELRERVRERLVERRARAARPRRGPGGRRHRCSALLAGRPGHRGRRCAAARLAHALAEFDAATIATTHQFCRQMLAGLGDRRRRRPGRGVRRVGGRPGRRGRRRPLRAQVRATGRRARRAFDRADALRLARRRRRRPAGPVGAAAAERRAAAAVRYRVRDGRARPRSSGASGRGGLHPTTTCSPASHDALADPAAARRRGCGPATGWCSSTSSRTPTRCSGRSCAHFHGHAHAGADRRPEAGDLRLPRRRRRHLPRGRAHGRRRTPRSPATGAATRRCSRALDTVFGGAALGDERIVVRPVEAAHAGAAAGRRAGRRPAAAAGARPRRAARAAAAGVVARRRTPATRVAARRRGGRRARCLGSSGATVDGAAAAARRRRRARAHQRPGRARSATRSRPSACPRCSRAPRASSAPLPPRDWLTLLEALEQPRPIRIRAAALTCFLGRTVAELCGPTRRRRRCSTSWAPPLRALGRGAARARGSPRCSRRSPPAPGLPGRLLGRADGERRLTDLRHVGQALHAAAVDAHLGPARAGGVAAPPHRRGRGGRRAGAQPAAGLRRRRRADHHRAPQQGPGVPGRVRAVRVGPLRAPRAGRAAAARRRRTRGCSTSAGRAGRGWSAALRARTRRRRRARTSGCSTWR